MKKIFVMALLINLNLYTMDHKDKKHHHHHHNHHKNHDKLVIYPSMEKKDIDLHIVLTDPVTMDFKKETEKKDHHDEGLLSKSLNTITAVFRYLSQ